MKRDRVVRRGIGMTIESDFYATDAGRQHFSDQLTSIRYCVQETCNFDCIFAYLTCGNYDFRYDLSKGLRPRRSVRTAMAHEIMMYCIVQKDGLGMDRAIEECKHRMSRYSVTPNMLICPPQLLLYLALAPEEKIRFIEGGERAVTKFEEGVAGYESRAYRGLGVFTSTPYEVSDDADSVQMLQRSTQVGEYYRMMPPHTWDPKKLLPPAHMDIVIYDEEADKHVHITFEQALYATCVQDQQFGAGLTSMSVAARLFGVTTQDAFRTKLQEHFGLTDGQAAGDVGDYQAIFGDEAGTAVHTLRNSDTPSKQMLVDCVKAGVKLPICITIARPFIEHLCMSAIMTVSGRDTGATLFGPADMQISANTTVKTIEGHYTCHTKSVITKPQNVLVMRDIMATGYQAGGNCRWFGCSPANDTKDINKGTNGNANVRLDPTFVAQAMQDRLAFTDDASGEYGSMLAFGSSYDDAVNSSRDQVISISERLLPWEIGRANPPAKSYFPGGQDGFQAYMTPYGLNTLHFGEDVRAQENMEFIAQGSVNNALCFLGPHRVYNPWAQNFYELVPGQGHFGPDALPGDARWRRGESVSLTSARNAMVGYEVAAHSQMIMQKANGI